MCMEDYKLGRETQSGSVKKAVGLTSDLAIGESVKRTALILSNPLANNVTFSLQNPAVSGQGIVLNVSTGPFSMDVQTHGDIVRRPWYCIADAGTPTVEIFFSMLEREN